MFYNYKNCKIQVNGVDVLTNSAQITEQSQNAPIYLSEDRSSFNYTPTYGIGGEFQINYYLTGTDVLKDFISDETAVISGNFGGLSFASGYLKSYSISCVPNVPVTVNASIVFFDELMGGFNPTYEKADEIPILNFADAVITNNFETVIGSIQNCTNFTYSFTSEIKPTYSVDSTIPDRIVFGVKETSLQISSDNISGFLPIYGSNAGAKISFYHPELPGVLQSYTCNGILYKRDISTSISQNIKSSFEIKENKTEEFPAPVIYYFLPSSGYIGTPITVYGKGFNNASRLQFFDRVPDNGFYVINDNTISTVVPQYSFTGPMIVTNPGGESKSSYDFLVLGKPISITSVTPITGKIGASVYISGENFYHISSVNFSNASSSFQVVNSNYLIAKVPEFAAWDYISIYSTGLGQSGRSNVKFVPVPRIDSFFPSSGISGDSIMIAGRGFSGITGVRFNNLPANSPNTAVSTVIGNTGISSIVPSGNTRGYISVYGQSGVSARSNVGFLPVIRITSVTPSSGRVGSLFTISGLGFLNQIMYPVGGGYLAGIGSATGIFTKLSDNAISGQVPASARTNFARIYRDDGSAYPSDVLFTVLNEPPTINYVNPFSGKYQDFVSIYGSKFYSVSDVILTGNGVGSVITGVTTSPAADVVTFQVPNLIGGTYNVIVDAFAGSATGVNMFLLLGQPVIGGFSPASGGVGFGITVTGNKLYPGSQVYIENTGIAAYTDPGSFVGGYSSLQFFIPANMPVSGRVIVDNGIGAATGGYLTLIPTPFISGFAPSSGIFGDIVLISGSGLRAVTGASIYSVNSSFQTVGDSGVLMTVPDNSASDYISLGSPGGITKTSTRFLVLPPNIVISGFSPILVKYGDSVLVSGRFLDKTRQLRVSGSTSELSPAYFNIGTTGIIFVVPNLTVDGKIKLVGDAGAFFSNGILQILPEPTIATFNPQSGIYRQQVNISGLHLTNSQFFLLNVTGGLVSCINQTIVGDTGAQFLVPREIVTSNIYISGSGLINASSTPFLVMPTISGLFPTGLTTGQVITLTGINAARINTTILGLTGNNANRNIIDSNGLFLDYSRITGGGDITTGYTIISGTIGNSFAGTGRTFLVSDADTGNFNSLFSYKNINSITGQIVNILQGAPIVNGFVPAFGNFGTFMTLSGYGLAYTTGIKFNLGAQVDFATIVGNPTNTNIFFYPPGHFNNGDVLTITVQTPYGSTVAGSTFTYSGSIGTSRFIDLTDCPNSITALNYLRGNAGGTALEFRTPSQVLSDIGGISLATANTSFYPLTTNPSGYLTSLSGSFYPLTGNPSGFLTNVSTGFLTGLFYPLTGNPSGFLTSGQSTGLFYPLVSNPSGFITSGQSGLLTGVFYPLRSNPQDYAQRVVPTVLGPVTLNTGYTGYISGSNIYTPGTVPTGASGIPLSGITGISGYIPTTGTNNPINWSLGNTFYTTISGNTTFSHINNQDSQTIVVLIRDTGLGATVSWSNSQPLFWPSGQVPAQTSGKTDVYTFIYSIGGIYGNVVQQFN